MNLSTEIRKLAPSNVRELVQILEDADCWKKLMEIIPKRLEKENYECNFSEENPQKYHSDHFRLIERASRSYQRSCSEILLDEWGTSGRVRPSLGHLLHLLKKAEVFRAADFVAMDLLKIGKPQRPSEGPAAPVHVTFLLEDRLDEIEEATETQYDSTDIRYLNAHLEGSSNTINNNIEGNLSAQRKNVHLVNPIPQEVSDMMKFSHSIEENDADIPIGLRNIPEADCENDNVPNISVLLHSNVPEISASVTEHNQVSEGENCIPQISALLNSKTEHTDLPQISKLLLISALLKGKTTAPLTTDQDGAPQISRLLENQELDVIIPQITALLSSNPPLLPEISALLSSNQNNTQIPEISALLNSTNIPQISQLLQPEEELIPQISALLTANSEQSSLLPQEIKKLLQSKRIDQYVLVPQLSALLSSSDEIIPEISKLLSSLPNDELSKLLGSLLPQVIERNDETVLESSSLPQISKLLQTGDETIKADKDFVPQISKLLNESSEAPHISNLLKSEFNPQISQLLKPETSDSSKPTNHDPESVLPQLLTTHTNSSLDNEASHDFLPQISDLLHENEAGSRPQSNPQIVVSNNPEAFQFPPSDPNNKLKLTDKSTSLLSPNLNPQTDSNEIPTLGSSPSSSASGRPQCNSPLPNLSLNTILPHFNYQELELATSNFDETPHPRGRFLGSGAFGSVFLCLGLLEKPTAVKKLHLDGATEVNVNDTITKQFRNEVELLCSYKHDNLLSICGYSCDGPTYCIMYEYISGGALNYRLENHKEELNWRDRMRIACGTAEAVAYLHTAYSRQLIHRDIKTANILLDSANKPKLGDFGIIKLSPNKNTTVTTTIIGTSVYMAPECFRSGEVTEKTDTFSFGVVILELLTALPPLDENREARDLITHVEDMCDNNSIAPLLDLSAGTWMKGEMNVAEELFKVANRCLGEKKHRPNMVEVAGRINKLVSS